MTHQSTSEKKNEIEDNICPFSSCPKDRPTKIAGLGWRFGYTLIAWIILGFGITEGNTFFVALLLFSIPLLMDYLKFKPVTMIRFVFCKVGVFVTGFWAIFGFLGLCGIFYVILDKNTLYIRVTDAYIDYKGLSFELKIVWRFVILNVFMTIVDWILNETPLEEYFIKRRQEKEKNNNGKKKKIIEKEEVAM
jgi:hypothetical protein